jgi:hypothetical protein
MKMDSEKFIILNSVDKNISSVLNGYKAFKEYRPNLKIEQILLGITSIVVAPPAPQGEYNLYLLKQATKLPGIVGLIIEFSCAHVEIYKKSRTEIEKIINKILNVLESENYSNYEKYGFLEKKYLEDGLKIFVDFTLEFTGRVRLLKKNI